MNMTAWLTRGKLAKRPEIRVVHERMGDPVLGGLEFVKVASQPCFIEPEHGYVITDNGVILEDSLVPNKTSRKRPFREAMPSFVRFERAQKSSDDVIALDRVVSIRHFWEWNYYHFYLDVLGKLELYNSLGLDPSIPVVVGDYFEDVAFPKQVTLAGEMSQVNWIVPGRKYVYAKEVYYCKTTRNYRQRLDYILDKMAVKHGAAGHDRLFLHRGTAQSRNIENLSQVVSVLGEHGFSPVDTSHLPVSEQIRLFQRARYVVSIHGAGNTNIMFRAGQPLDMLELHASTFLNHDHQRICQEYGYGWDHLPCEPVGNTWPGHACFRVDPLELERRIRAMVER